MDGPVRSPTTPNAVAWRSAERSGAPSTTSNAPNRSSPLTYGPPSTPASAAGTGRSPRSARDATFGNDGYERHLDRRGTACRTGRRGNERHRAGTGAGHHQARRNRLLNLVEPEP